MIPVLLLAAPAPTPEAQKIEALIQAVADLQGAVFIRNGTEHSPKEAADHLRLKWKNAGRRVKTAPEFIQYCASGSSLSGKPYEIRLQDGRTVPARDWLWTELKRMESGH
ncbi:MAG: DUF5329 domain-containing protein [Geothrix sp.]|uniref:DUF5329 domain-containing protein n=1 Tax=Geothrix sp. TaxID=1962974 RepID=UPI0017D4FAEE|nr:DUF5329 domain-containing protein [Geothrix sp.]NWJ40768.1 DUF5329 domain-containing protein [Geothrix sp.]WIL21226.1 MAG: DUF5329 domain-containing protein [Geothrix sp.]